VISSLPLNFNWNSALAVLLFLRRSSSIDRKEEDNYVIYVRHIGYDDENYDVNSAPVTDSPLTATTCGVVFLDPRRVVHSGEMAKAEISLWISRNFFLPTQEAIDGPEGIWLNIELTGNRNWHR
jgi:hypothetical protein